MKDKNTYVETLLKGIETLLSENRSSLSSEEVECLKRAMEILRKLEQPSLLSQKKAQVNELIEIFLKFYGKVKLVELLKNIFEDYV